MNWRLALFLLFLKTSFMLSASDAGITAILNPNGNFCAQPTGFYPVIVLKNFGASPINSCGIKYRIDNSTLQTYNWAGFLPASQSATVTLAYINTFPGSNHTFTSYSDNPNGSNDSDLTNDTFKVDFYYPDMFLQEDFNGSVFPPLGWKILNADSSITWGIKATDTSHITSLYMDNFNYNDSSKGQVDEIISPVVVLGTYPECSFQFSNIKFSDPATNPTYLDTLELFISPDCGVTWASVWKKYGSQLITSAPPFDTSEYTPAYLSDWQYIYLGFEIQPWNGIPVIFKFRHVTDCENNLFIDNFNVWFYFGLNEYGSNTDIDVYPNPVKDMAEIRISNYNASRNYSIQLVDVLGKTVFEDIGQFPNYHFNRIALKSGIYILKVLDDNGLLVGGKKVVLE